MDMKTQSQATDLKQLFPQLIAAATEIPHVESGNRKVDFRKALEQMDAELCAQIDADCTDQEYFDAYCKLHVEMFHEAFVVAD